MSKFWTMERVAHLRRLHGENLSGTKIAEAMGPGVTRNMVISKCAREGLVHSESVQAANRDWELRTGLARKVRAPRPASQSPFRTKAGPKPKPKEAHGLQLGTDFQQTPEAAAAKRAIFRAEGLSLVERVESGAGVTSIKPRPFREMSGCKWPLAGGLFCCNRVVEGHYCPGHDNVAHGRTPIWSPATVESFVSRFTQSERIETSGEADNDDIVALDEGRAA